MTRHQITRAAMRYRRKQDEALMVRREAKTKQDKGDCTGRAFAYGEVARWLEGVLRRMKK